MAAPGAMCCSGLPIKFMSNGIFTAKIMIKIEQVHGPFPLSSQLEGARKENDPPASCVRMRRPKKKQKTEGANE